MDTKADVRAITARFNAGKSNSTEGMSSAGRPRAALHSTLSSGPPPQPKKPVLENLSGNAVAIPPKPNHLTATKSAPEVRDMAKSKAPANVFTNAKEDGNSKPSFAKQQFPFKPTTPHPSSSQDPEAKSPGPKPPPYKPSLSSALLEAKPVPPKPSPAVTSKPSSLCPTPPKVMLQNKTNSSFAKLRLQNEEEGGSQTDSSANARTFPPPSSALKPISNFRAAQTAFNRDKSVDQSEERDRNVGANKKPLSTASATPCVPPISKKPSFIKKPQGPTSRALGVRASINSGDPSAPKRNPLPNILALGNAPSKPNRPPEVNLERFMTGPETSTDGPGFKKTILPPPLTSHPRNHASNVASPPISQFVAPSLPPRPPGAIIQPDPDENYDDIASLVNKPPPLPTTGHPNQIKEQDSESDGEMYEFLDDRWGEAEIKEQEKRKEKDDKKRQEVEKKEQRERERKEQEAIKKFKLSGPLPVIHRAQARVDCKGNKTDLSLKQGEFVDIVRVMDNPGGRWLGRMQDGTYGYVKTDAVEVDFDSLKRRGESLPHPMDHDPDVYDDIDVVTSTDFNRVPGVILPPPPEEAGELYDDLDDPKFNVRLPPPSQFTANRWTDQSAPAIDEDIYDDVDTLPPPIPLSSPPSQTPTTKPEEIDPKRQKKFEKEEKDFRKKFKFDGEINVLYPVTVVRSLTNKKWSGKDLPIRAGETLDVIAKSTDNKLICRNDEGKFGYVLASHINQEDGDLYDDIGSDCVYDND